jgi:hypothetical protein
VYEQKCLCFSPHGTLKYIRINFVQQNWIIRAHFGFLEVATEEHCLKHRAAPTQNHLVAFEVLQNKLFLVECFSLDMHYIETNPEARIGILEVAANSDGAVVEITSLESRQQVHLQVHAPSGPFVTKTGVSVQLRTHRARFPGSKAF